MSAEVSPPALFPVLDPTDARDAAQLLTERYAVGADLEAWRSQGVTLPLERAVLAVFADPSPSRDALIAVVALVPRGQAAWGLYEHLAMTLAREMSPPVPWERLGPSKQAAKQKFERRERDAPRPDLGQLELERARPPAGQRAWLDEHAAELRHVVSLLQAHRPELLDIDSPTAFAVHDLGRVQYHLGDQEVLAAARRVVTAIQHAVTTRAALPVWDQVRLPEGARTAVDRLAALVATAP
ncbi:hypothetical protein GCM10022252_75280 [Streptosporangium oxazolinicum]|uniref:Uncharacterized protein n=1 Tax=Streptosporangium oxazolinicum TaxID=909287 RepID=A0ABP8BKG0_9ACTN